MLLYVKFRGEKHYLVKHFAFFKTFAINMLQVTYCFSLRAAINVLQVTYCFSLRAADWPTTNFLGGYVMLFSCNPIGQICLGGPSYSSRAVKCWQRRI